MELVRLHGARRKNATVDRDGDENAGPCETLLTVLILNLFWTNQICCSSVFLLKTLLWLYCQLKCLLTEKCLHFTDGYGDPGKCFWGLCDAICCVSVCVIL